jgi:peptidoglycan/xylan/chitin deacetylase (PgdA/CDA1 family)
MRIRGLGRLRRVARQLSSCFTSEVLILLYHRVADLPLDSQLLGVTPQHFAEHLEILRRYGRPMRLQQLIQALQSGRLPRRAVVITFDDGYADNLYYAKPLLERYDTPATVFMTTGYIGQRHEFWWDELERLLLEPGTLPATLRLHINGSLYQWELGETAHYDEKTAQRHRCWNTLEKYNPSQRQSIYRTLCQLLRPLPNSERQMALNELRAQTRVASTGRLTHCPLTSEEIYHLAEGGLVEVGAHTVTHPVLSALPPATQRSEIEQSKLYLEALLGHPITSFAYPYGSRSDYMAETVTAVEKAGFICACANFPGTVQRHANNFELPRVVVRDWNGDKFARRLRQWFCS